MMMRLRFLLLEDNPLDAHMVEATLKNGGIDCELLRVQTRPDFVAALLSDKFDLILADYALPTFDGIAALEIACHRRPDVPFIFLSGSLGEELAIKALKSGATDYVLKQRLGRLVPSVQRALGEAQERRKRQWVELMLVEQRRLLELIASGHLLDECLAAICASVSELHPGTRACFLLSDVQRATFQRSITPDFPSSFGQGLEGAPINALCIGTCGEAVYRGEPMTCADIANDESWSKEWRDLCVAHGILACHSKSVMGVDGLPLGSLMLCFDKARMPTDWEYQLADFSTQVASIVFERERTSLARRESEQRYRTLFESIDEGFCICEMLFDENGEPTDYQFVEVNPVFGRLTGLEQATGKTARELVPHLEDYWFEIYARVVVTGVPIRFEAQSIAMNNRWFDVNAFPIGEPQSNQFAILFTNISDRKQAQQQLQQTLQTLQTLIAASPLPIVVIEPGCIVQLWNPAAEQLFGWSEAEVLGKPIPIVPPEKQEECRQVREAVINKEIFSGVETYRCKQDGSIVIVSISAALLDENNRIILLFQDITERQQAEKALRSSEAQLQTLFNEAPLGVYLIDGDFRIRQVNPTALPAFGNIPDLIGRDFNEVTHVLWSQKYANEIVARFRHTLETGEPYFVPEWIEERRDRGVIEYYEWQINRIPLPDGRYGVVCYFRDISAQVFARQVIAESESRFRLIVESAKDYAIFTLDLNGIIVSWNSGAQRLLGYTETEALGCNGRMIFTPEDKEQGRAEWEMQTARTEERVENERWHVRKDGSQFWASGLMMPLQNQAGNIQGFVKILQDKTTQRQAEQRLQLLYETTRDLLATQHPMELMNNLFSKLSAQLELHSYYNYMAEAKDNRTVLHLRNYGGISDDAARSIEWIEFGQYLCGMVAQERRQVVFNQAQISTHPNAQLICSMGITAYAGYPLIVRGRLLGTLSFASVTRTHFTPEEIDLLQSTCEQMAIAIERANLLMSIQQQAEQLQQANRIKDEFLAIVSHELRSPLNPILGWSKLLQTQTLDQAKTTQALGTIARNAKLQAELIEDLLDISRILRGKLSLNVSPTDLVSTIQAAMETMRLAALAKSIQMNATLEANIGLVSGDSSRLQQVVWNLLSNAIKFTPSGGRVDIRLERLGYVAQITVSDTGKGIHPDFLPHVFDYFRQENGATTRKFGGLGLGLAIVHHLVELHGGTVQAESPGEGQGATFTVRLPLMPTSPQINQESSSSELASDLTGIKVLIVDDDADTREFVAFLIEQYGADVISVASAGEALVALTRSQPDVLISDIGMPEVDGYMFLRQVRALPPKQGGLMPAIALTAYAGEIDYQQAMLAGFQRHVPKPVEPEVLMGVIADLVQQSGGQTKP
jgi:PAS domain S-box-containing protein